MSCLIFHSLVSGHTLDFSMENVQPLNICLLFDVFCPLTDVSPNWKLLNIRKSDELKLKIAFFFVYWPSSHHLTKHSTSVANWASSHYSFQTLNRSIRLFYRLVQPKQGTHSSLNQAVTVCYLEKIIFIRWKNSCCFFRASLNILKMS